MTLLRNLTGTTPVSDDVPNVEKVFSTYLYEGTGATRDINNGIKLSPPLTGTSTDFDGTNDYLSRSTALTGSADGKTFTFSGWVWPVVSDTAMFAIQGATNYNNRFGLKGGVQVMAQNSSGTDILGQTGVSLALKTWSHVLISVDLSNTSKRYIYVNDVLQSPAWNTYVNDNIDFTHNEMVVGAKYMANYWSPVENKIAHVYLDYTYRDLSVEANRRLFIDANGGSTPPATLSALNPIMYLPMTTAYSIGENLGSGGDFTSNGSPTIVDSGTEYVADPDVGGLVWIKWRSGAIGSGAHVLVDTERGVNYWLSSSTTSAQNTTQNSVTAFNSNGFSIVDAGGKTNYSGDDYASWTFRKAPRFFDVVTYTGNGVAGREIAHSLNCDVGMVMIKNLDGGDDWGVYHRGNTANPETDYLLLNTTAATADHSNMWFDTLPTTTQITLGDSARVNQNTENYVAYIFAHDPVGEDNDGMIACGSYTPNYPTEIDIDLGWEPQFVLVRASNQTCDWAIFDNMRGVATGGDSISVYANTTAGDLGGNRIDFTATGFRAVGGSTVTQGTGTRIYMAIRAPMMKEPEAGTEVFAVDVGGSVEPTFNSGFVTDAGLVVVPNNSVSNNFLCTRLLSGTNLYTNTIDAETTASGRVFDYMDGFDSGTAGSTRLAYLWKRAKGFFDVVAYTGTGSAHTENHSLGVVPEMMIAKCRTQNRYWVVYHSDLGSDKYLRLSVDSSSATSTTAWNDTVPTDSLFTLGTFGEVNASSQGFISYLFASLDGVSKVGSYTGNGSNQNIDCGFSGGARFVLIKRTDTNGDWYLWDTERGIVAGNDPHLSLNSTSAEVTSDDSIDPYSTGFTVNQVAATNINVTSATYIFLAIA